MGLAGAALMVACDIGPGGLAAAPDRSAPAAEGLSIGVSTSELQFVATIIGFRDPESVRYDPEQDVFFVSNMAGHGSVRDGNGYIIRVSAADLTRSEVFVQAGREGAMLDAPKGMTIQGDTLWVTDIDVVRGFDRRTGAPLATVDFRRHGAVLLNDIAVGPDGTLRVTDTGLVMNEDGIYFVGPARVFAVGPGAAIRVIASGPAIGQPNGITWDRARERWIVASFDPFVWEIRAIADSDSLTEVFSRTEKGELDGIEVLESGAILYSSWADSSLHLLENGRDRRLLRELREPADIGVDTRRRRVAIPMPITGWVQLWSLGGEGR